MKSEQTLPSEKLPDFIIWESDFSEFVAEVYGRPFQYQQMVMAGQDTYVEFTVEDVSDDEWVSTYAQPQLTEWIAAWANLAPGEYEWSNKMYAEREQPVDLDVLTWDLHHRGLLPAGTYLMKVYW